MLPSKRHLTSVLAHTLAKTHTAAEALNPCCSLNRLISLLMWDLGVFEFIEGADTDQDVFAVHGLSLTSGWIKEKSAISISLEHSN